MTLPQAMKDLSWFFVLTLFFEKSLVFFFFLRVCVGNFILFYENITLINTNRIQYDFSHLKFTLFDLWYASLAKPEHLSSLYNFSF